MKKSTILQNERKSDEDSRFLHGTRPERSCGPPLQPLSLLYLLRCEHGLACVDGELGRHALNHPRDGYRAHRSRRERGLRRHGAHRAESNSLAPGGRGENFPGRLGTGEIRHRSLQGRQTGREALICLNRKAPSIRMNGWGFLHQCYSFSNRLVKNVWMQGARKPGERGVPWSYVERHGPRATPQTGVFCQPVRRSVRVRGRIPSSPRQCTARRRP